jgi:hypothetical protein
MNVEKEVKDAIVTRLRSDAAVIALVAGRVFDRVEPTSAFPYVNIGPTDTVSDDAECIVGFELAQQIDCWSRSVGFAQVQLVVDAVRAALHDYDLPLPTNALVFFEHRTTRIVRDPDGITSHGILGFEAVIERN